MSGGLEKLGIPGPEYLREQLTNCDDPTSTIETFQNENCVILPSLRTALPLLDLHGVRRLDFHQSVLEVLKDKLKSRLDTIVQSAEPEVNDPTIAQLVEKNFVLIDFEPLRDVLLDAISRLHKVPEKYLVKLQNDKAIYTSCPITIKRQIWQNNQSLFGDEISPMLSEYIKQKENVLYSVDVQKSFMNLTPKMRRQDLVIQRLTECIGTNVHLYDIILQFLRTLFLRTRNVHYCTLRTELLMNFHDIERTVITSIDPCYKFTWCMDACIKDKEVDVKRARELQSFIHSLKRDRDRVLGDVAMVVCDPYTVNTLVTSVFRQLQIMSTKKNVLPKRNDDLILVMRLLTLAISAWDIIDSQNFREPKVDPKLLTNFCPCLIGLIIDDQIKPVELNVDKMENLLSQRDRSKESKSIYDEDIPRSFSEGIENSKIAGLLAAAYLNHLARAKNKIALVRVLKCVMNSDADLVYSDMFMHQFVFSLVFLGDDVASDVDFRSFVFDEYFLPMVKKDSVQRHALRLISLVKDKLSSSQLLILLDSFKPMQSHTQFVKDMYSGLSKSD